jgi:phosphodiesterase/alkaline phosphatase D-like protein
MVLADGTKIKIPKYSAVAATLTLDSVTDFTATYRGQVIRHSLDLKVTVYYSTTDNLTVYKHKGKTSVTEFNGDTFTLCLTELTANTTYYYFTEVISNGTVKYSQVGTFRTGKADSYVDWEEGDHVSGEI